MRNSNRFMDVKKKRRRRGTSWGKAGKIQSRVIKDKMRKAV